MNHDAIRETLELSLKGKINFPQVVGRLMENGIESYHVDLVRNEYRYYHPSGETLVQTAPHPAPPAAKSFSAPAVSDAIKASQRGEINFQTFLEKIAAAGCVYYVTYLAGKRVVYSGREGDFHVEPFPQPK